MTRWEYHKNQGLPGKGNFPEEEEGADEEGDEGAGEDAAAKMVVPSGGLPMLHKVRAHGERGGQAEGVRAKLRLRCCREAGARHCALQAQGLWIERAIILLLYLYLELSRKKLRPMK